MRYTKLQNEQWDKLFQRLVAYKKQHKSTTVPKGFTKDPTLAIWVRTQRKVYVNIGRDREISVERIRRLDSIGFVWKHNDLVPWEEMYRRLVAYKKKHKNTTVPQKYAVNPQLGIWVSHQRTNYSSKQLSTERTNLLKSIGFVWDAPDARWMEMYSKLIEHKKQNKSTAVPKRYTEDPSLGFWVSTQRVAYYKGKLSGKRMKLLDSINFVWAGRK
ncbi:hypothetical protein FRACYDRAFT_204715 [Fragilariopsis cylindrus CCMP1102]|uniref:Helicase-associated domain-containing protein n=1 Tax=Fragilariopsis cylindrus CCMP1102 TaxID=635003 RepID=A0A1E7EIJ0_9STRA|nr:hypothetical protein FRACYDRAFT_204715 [Fragilariopsis cylindrus CCMP1102]|eukprot:OEU05702.1 hypothetical protein FRACYDRAFT_204715 [Fragilariopsis cylindrus CCMP1102]